VLLEIRRKPGAPPACTAPSRPRMDTARRTRALRWAAADRFGGL